MVYINIINLQQHFVREPKNAAKSLNLLQNRQKAWVKINCTIFDQDDYEVFLRKGRIIATLRNAIVNHYDGFEVYYQPIVDCQSEQIIGAEALMRFSMITEEEAGSLFTDQVIPLFEGPNSIIPAGGYI